MKTISARYLLGPDSAFAGQRLADKVGSETDWPYPHIFPPPDSETVHAVNNPPVAVPVAGATVSVLSYRVPSGYRFFMLGILQNYSGGAFNPGDGLWTVTTNAPGGVSDIQAAPVQGLYRVPFPLGSWLYGVWWPLTKAYDFESDTLVQSSFTNVNLGSGPPNYLVSGFFGFNIPTGEVRR